MLLVCIELGLEIISSVNVDCGKFDQVSIWVGCLNQMFYLWQIDRMRGLGENRKR